MGVAGKMLLVCVVAAVMTGESLGQRSTRAEGRNTVMPLGGPTGPLGDSQIDCKKVAQQDEDQPANRCEVAVSLVADNAEKCGWKIVLVGADVVHVRKKQRVAWKISQGQDAVFRPTDGVVIDGNDSGEGGNDKNFYACDLGSGNAIGEVSCKRAHGNNSNSKKNRSRAFSYTLNLLVGQQRVHCELDPIIVSRD